MKMDDFKLPEVLHLGIGSRVSGIEVQKMSRLKRKKKNHHPPFEEPLPNFEKDGNGTKNVNLMESSVQKLETSIPKIFKRAIASAQKHHIRLEPGIKNQGHGNCS